MAPANDTAVIEAVPGSRNVKEYSELLQTPHSDAFAFGASEKLALDLYDQLQELELQTSLLEAQNHVSDVSAMSEHDLEEHLTIAQREATEAKAKYEMRNRISHSVTVMDPVLKAVHGGEDTDMAEKRILPLITENDTVSMVHGSLAARLSTAMLTLKTAEQGNIAANRENRELSQKMLALAKEIKVQTTEDIEDPQLRDQVAALEKEVKYSRRRMKTIKGILSAMIVGSGINWAADNVLRELVMDDEEDG